MEFLESMNPTTWSVLAGGLVIIGLILFLKFSKTVLKIILIAAVLAAIVYVLIEAGVIALP